MASALATWKRLKWIKQHQSLSTGGRSPELGFGGEQRVNHCIAINPETPMGHIDPRAAGAARQTSTGSERSTERRRWG
jgi:hypothetical protein